MDASRAAPFALATSSAHTTMRVWPQRAGVGRDGYRRGAVHRALTAERPSRRPGGRCRVGTGARCGRTETALVAAEFDDVDGLCVRRVGQRGGGDGHERPPGVCVWGWSVGRLGAPAGW